MLAAAVRSGAAATDATVASTRRRAARTSVDVKRAADGGRADILRIASCAGASHIAGDEGVVHLLVLRVDDRHCRQRASAQEQLRWLTC